MMIKDIDIINQIIKKGKISKVLDDEKTFCLSQIVRILAQIHEKYYE